MISVDNMYSRYPRQSISQCHHLLRQLMSNLILRSRKTSSTLRLIQWIFKLKDFCRLKNNWSRSKSLRMKLMLSLHLKIKSNKHLSHSKLLMILKQQHYSISLKKRRNHWKVSDFKYNNFRVESFVGCSPCSKYQRSICKRPQGIEQQEQPQAVW